MPERTSAVSLSAVNQRCRNVEQLFTEVCEQSRWYDWLVLAVVPTVLIAIFTLPRLVKWELALAYAQPTLRTAFTSHFVHLSASHLLTNLVAYSTIVPLVYIFSLVSGHRTHFYIGFVTILLAFPFALSALDVLLVRPRIGFGFSAITMAFLGFLPVSLLWFFEARLSPVFDLDHAPLFFFFGMGLIAVWGAPITGLSLGVAVISVALAMVYLRSLLVALPDRRLWRRLRAGGRGYVEFASLAIVLFFTFLFAAFPSHLVTNGAILNVFSHLLGYTLGFIVPYTTFRLIHLGERSRQGSSRPSVVESIKWDL